MKVKLRKNRLRETFLPSWCAVFLNPFYFARYGLYQAISEYSESLTGDLLDVGCGTKPYKSLFNVPSYIGLDIDSHASRSRGIADYFYDGACFPFRNEMFDSVLCSQVLEHVFHPDQFLTEIYRVMRPGAKMLLTVPFLWDEHEQPYDYARYSSFGLIALLEKNGFVVLEHKKVGADASCLFQLSNAYLFKISINWNRYLRLFFVLMAMGPINLLGLIAKRTLPSNPDLFLDHVALIQKP